MPTLTSSLLNLTSLMTSLSELAGVKKHLFRASREILLAVQNLLEIAEQHVGDLTSKSDYQQTLQGAMDYARKVIRTLVKQLPRGDEEEFRVLHRKVLGSILEVLEGEIGKNTRKENQKSKMKVEVLQAIRNVLLKEMYEQETKGAESHDKRH